MKTVNGIELDLEKSSYKSEYLDHIFYFSSELYKKKFEEKILAYVLLETAKIRNKYNVKINMQLYLAVSLYKKIEKRGFRIVSKNMGYCITELTCFEASNFC